MELAEFVKDTLVQIIDGVRQAQQCTELHGAVINPIEYGTRTNTVTEDDRSIQTIEFDVAVTAESSRGGGAKISVWQISAGGEGSAKDSVVSRIKFSVLVALPSNQKRKPPTVGKNRSDYDPLDEEHR